MTIVLSSPLPVMLMNEQLITSEKEILCDNPLKIELITVPLAISEEMPAELLMKVQFSAVPNTIAPPSSRQLLFIKVELNAETL